MPARLLVIGLDAAEPAVFDSMQASERFPTLTTMRRLGASGSLVGHHDLLTDTVWPEIRSGSSGIRTGIYYQPRQIRSGESRVRSLRPDELKPERFYWNVAAQSGLKVAAVDQPLAPGHPTSGPVEIVEWGTHDHCGFERQPTDPMAARIVGAHGDYPTWHCDDLNNGHPEGRQRLWTSINEGIDRKTDLFTDLLRADDWDLFTAVLSEAHCAGHHFWPLQPADLGDLDRADPGVALIESVYSRLDATIGALVGAAGEEATVIVYASHGMGPIDHGATIVPDVLEEMGLVSGNRRRRRFTARVPRGVRGKIRGVVDPAIAQRLGFTYDRPLGDRNTVAIPLPNTRHGSVRLSLMGRDPGGVLKAGSEEHRRVLDDLSREFTALRAVGTGETVVEDVVVTDEVFGLERHPDLPDVLVRFRNDIGAIHECESESLGRIRGASVGHRTGEHGTPGAVWATGPAIPSGRSLGAIQTVDLAPTVLAALDLPIPSWIDGDCVSELVGS